MVDERMDNGRPLNASIFALTPTLVVDPILSAIATTFFTLVPLSAGPCFVTHCSPPLPPPVISPTMSARVV